jgi:hypothetical protein
MKKAEFNYEHGLIKVKNKYYEVFSDCRKGKLVFEEVKDAKEKIKMSKKIAKLLEDSLDREKVLTEATMKMRMTDVKKLYAMLTSGKEYTKVTREHRCVDMKIGNFILPIINE